MAAQNSGDARNAFLLGGSPSLEEVYNPVTGHALLIPGVPQLLPTPSADAVRIGIIDSGVLADHPQLRNLVVAMKSFAGTDPADNIGHGTLVALQTLRLHADPEIQGLLGEKFEYPALISARVTDQYGVPSVDAVIQAIDWVVEQGAKLVNLSLGFRGDTKEFENLCEAITQHSDTMFFAAAGNFGPEVKVYPAACSAPNLMSVGELRGGKVTASSGKGDIYAPTDDPLYQPWQYYLDLGNRASRAGDFVTARKQYALSLAQHKNTGALFQMALLDIQSEDFNTAVINLQQALELDPGATLVRSHLGAVRFMQERFDQAEILLSEALRQDPQDQQAAFNLGLTYLNLDRIDQALYTFQKLQQKNHEYPRLKEIIAETKRRLG
uniref:S8 family serine peptidase n=1 Tax=Marinobacterium profundum TaxID=1714300 RepID=UPI000830AB69|nr:S8 family serine peptidase [Marinobacterium profundum]